MKKLILASLLTSTLCAQASTLKDIEKGDIHHIEIAKSFNSFCVYSFDFKADENTVIANIKGEVLKENQSIKVSKDILDRSQYALLKLNCSLNPLPMMYLGDTIEIIEGRDTYVAIQAQLSVVLNDGYTHLLPIHSSSYKALRSENAGGEKSISFDNQDHLYLDMIKFY